MESPLVPQVLLQHGQFVRALARSLLRDGHAAEDVAQETWARYFESRPTEERGLRQWFRVVARNLAVNRGRTERGRAAREELAARPEAVPSAHEELEHGELLGVVVQAVLALDEPYRATIVARYYRGLDPETIAQQSGTTAATVRSREHRALEKLRESLDRHMADRQSKAERGAWAAVLARFAGPGSAVAVSASASGGWLGARVAVGLAVVAAGTMLWLREPATSAANSASSVASVPSPAPSAPAALALPASGQRLPLGEDSSGRENASSATLTDIRGRLVFPGRVPAAGVELKLRGWGGSKDETLLYGTPADWVDPSATSDEQGVFSLRFDPPRAFQFILTAKAPGHAEVSWRWDGFALGAVLDLGEVELPVGGSIEGRIVDAQGRPIVGPGWSVVAETIGLGVMGGRDDTRVYAAVEPSTGAFRLSDVWPGPVGLSADAPMTRDVQGPRVVAVSGQTITTDIVYTGPDFSHRIAVETSSRPFYVMNDPDPAHVKLVAEDGTVRTASGRSPLVFDDLPAGFYSVQIDDPRYVPWSREGVVPGERVRARLVGPSALRLNVADAEGRALERFAVRVTFRQANSSATQFEVHDGQSPLAGGLVSGLFPGDYTLTVLTADGASASAEVVGLAAGETRSLPLQLEAVVALTGRVVHPDGAPVARAQLTLLAPAERDDSAASPLQLPGRAVFEAQYWRRALSAAVADENGEFRLVPPRPGTYLVLAEQGACRASSDAFELAGEPPRLALVLPRPGAVRGRVHLPQGASGAGLTLWIPPAELCAPLQGMAMHTSMWHAEKMGESLQRASVPLGADGSFELAGLAPGPSKAFLLLASAIRNGFSTSDSGVHGSLPLGELVVPEGDVLERDFELMEFPGTVVLEVTVNGVPAPGLEITLSSDDAEGADLEGSTDGEGRVGPLSALAGVWSVTANDPQAHWSGVSATPVFVEPGREARVTVDFVLARGALTCVDANGSPLAGQTIAVLPTAGGWMNDYVTDANGRVELELVPGEYAVQRGEFNPGVPAPETVPLTWTATGPLSERVQL